MDGLAMPQPSWTMRIVLLTPSDQIMLKLCVSHQSVPFSLLAPFGFLAGRNKGYPRGGGVGVAGIPHVPARRQPWRRPKDRRK